MRIEMNYASLEDVMRDLMQGVVASEQAVVRTQNFLAQSVSQRAKIKIRSGAKSGKFYIRQNPTRGHQASAPGQSPADDTGRLANSITFRKVSRSNETAWAGTDLAYGGELERGFTTEFGDYVAPRPWLLPSWLEATARASKKLRAEFEAARK